MVDLGPHLCVDGEPAIEPIAWFGEQPHGEFALEHEYADPRRWREGKEFEG